MRRVVVVRPEATAEALEIGHWYEECELGLGRRFLGHVQEAVERIGESPTQFPIYLRKHRKARVRGFPHGVFFVDLGTDLIIVAIIHLSRDPRFIRRAIRGRG